MAMSGPVSTVAKAAAADLSGGDWNGSRLHRDGVSLNLVAEIEARLDRSRPGAAVWQPNLAATIPEAASIVLVLFDGLGDLNSTIPAAAVFRRARRGALDAPFPTTTTVSMSTVATGTSPSTHGVIAHLSWFPELGRVVNTLKWVDLSGAAGRLSDRPACCLAPTFGSG